MGQAVRDWAWAHPHEWSLIYGSPVPGYQAPEETVVPALELVRVLAAILAPVHGPGAGGAALPVKLPVSRELGRWLALVRDPYLQDLPDAVVALAVVAYVHLLGAVSLELFGQFGPDATPSPAIFDHGLQVTAALLGLPTSP